MANEMCRIHPMQEIQWFCETCQAPLCKACGAGAFQGKVYCSKCLARSSTVSVGQSPTSEKGLGLGIGLAFLLPILVSVCVLPIVSGRGLEWLSPVIALLSYLAALFITKRTGRTAVFKGLLIGLVIQISLVVLLAAACFGIALLGGILIKR